MLLYCLKQHNQNIPLQHMSHNNIIILTHAQGTNWYYCCLLSWYVIIKYLDLVLKMHLIKFYCTGYAVIAVTSWSNLLSYWLLIISVLPEHRSLQLMCIEVVWHSMDIMLFYRQLSSLYKVHRIICNKMGTYVLA